MGNNTVELKEAVRIRQTMAAYRDSAYLNMLQQINSKAAAVLKDDMGSQFVQNCGRDIAGELVRNCFDTTSYNITVDQLARRILHFSYENEYDPLSEQTNPDTMRKNAYAYKEFDCGFADSVLQKMQINAVNRECAELDNRINFDDDGNGNYEKLFKKEKYVDTNGKTKSRYEDHKLIESGKKAYAASREDENGDICDEYTGQKGKFVTDNRGSVKRREQVDHRQDLATAKYNKRYLSEEGVNELKKTFNSPVNFAMLNDTANQVKGDAHVYAMNGHVLSYSEVVKEKEKISKEMIAARGKAPKPAEVNAAFLSKATDVTHKATPKQKADAVCGQLENVHKDETRQKLKDDGILNEDGKVPKSVRTKLEENIKESQNAESKTIIKTAKYGTAAHDALGATKASIGKIIAGQIIYYAAPPIIYETKKILKDKTADIHSAIDRLAEACKRVGEYVFSKLKDIFVNVIANSLKKFIRSFMDILISLVKATVQKLLKIAKSLVLSVVDAVRIVADKNATRAEKADAVFNLFGVTITTCVIEVLFEVLGNVLHIPEPLDDIIFGPLQILTTVVCTNLTMLILQKADLFDVRFGFKMNAIRKVFNEEQELYNAEMNAAESYSSETIAEIIASAQAESKMIYNDLLSLDPRKETVRGDLDKVNHMFSMNINFEKEWLHFIGMDEIPTFA